jgi:hypothetical protein
VRQHRAEIAVFGIELQFHFSPIEPSLKAGYRILKNFSGGILRHEALSAPDKRKWDRCYRRDEHHRSHQSRYE